MTAGPHIQPRPVPRPAGVRGNEWRQVALPDARAFAPSLPVSVIVPCFEAPEALALTLAGLERQRFPRHLFEVVVVDDGSQPPIEAPGATPLAVRVVRQQRRGFGLARARNAGARAAAHDILVFLDGDVIAEADLLAAHARWHETVSDALTLGFCAFVSAAGIDAAAVRRRRGTLAALFAHRPCDPPWFERHLARTADLTADRDDLFRAVTGHNFGIGRAFFEAIGGFDESFVRYGGEDTELGWRAQVRGGLLVPVRDAFGWHQGRWSEGRAAKERSQDLQAGKLADLIADPGFRPGHRVPCGGGLAVPRHVVSLDGRGVPAGRIEGAVRSLLDDPCPDLAVRIELGQGRNKEGRDEEGRNVEGRDGEGGNEEGRNEEGRNGDRSRLAARFATEPRVRVAPGRHALDDHPATPFHIALPAGLDIGAGLVTRLRKALGDAAAAELALPGGASVTIARARMLHRARRAGGGPGDYGAVRTLPARILRGGGRMPRRPKPRPAPHGARAVLARVWAEARHVRGPRTAWRFLRWLAGALRWRLRVGGGWTAAPAPEAPRRPAPALGVTIAARGPRARAVFPAAAQPVAGAGARDAEVVLADTPADAAGRDAPEAPVVLLGEAPWLAVPAVDPAADNPMGWVREVEPRVAALGPTRQLPPGVRAHRQVHERDHVALAHCHHLEDTAAFHGGAVRRAGTLARLAARGVPVQLADADAGLEALLGPELHGLMTAGARGADAARREALSIAMRRAALRRHSVGARVRQICAAAGPGPHARAPAPPLVSVLLATRRPAFLAGAVANVARQTWPRIELVLALHGPGFEAAAIEGALAGFPHPVRLVRLGEEHTLGAVLGAATAQARGPLLAKMDDDDLYGPEHLWDLVLAHEYSGAALVGKFPATVYLASLDRTVRQRAVPAETWSPSITGGTLLLHRDDLARAGGWRPAPRHVDRLLVDDVLAAGGAVYRTHGAGYLMVRHRHGHTWEAGEERFLANAEAVHRGWRPEIADIPSGIAASPPPREPAA